MSEKVEPYEIPSSSVDDGFTYILVRPSKELEDSRSQPALYAREGTVKVYTPDLSFVLGKSTRPIMSSMANL